MPVSLPPLVWRESPNQSRRTESVRLVVVHRPVGSYESAIRTLLDPDRDASYHVIVREDGREATQLVPWDRKAWACVNFNSVSDNVCTPDWIWSRDVLTDEARFAMQTCARVVAFRLHKRELPAEWIRGRDLLNLSGFTRHFDLGASGGGHSDPTTDMHRWLTFVGMVSAELNRGRFRAEWGR